MISNYNFGTRLAFGFGAVILLLAMVGGFAQFGLHELSDLNRRMFQHPFRVSNTVRRIDANIIRIHRAMKDVALAENASQIDSAESLVGQLEQAILRDFQIVETYFLGDKAMLRRASDMFQKWKPLRDEVFRLKRDGRAREAAEITKGREAVHVERISASMKNLTDFAEMKAREFYDHTRTQMLFMTRLLWIVAGGAILIALLFTVYISRSVVRPVKEIAAAAEEIADGRIDVPISHHGPDEIGQMANSLRRMLSGIIGEGLSIRRGIPFVFWMADTTLTLTFLNDPARQRAQRLTGTPPDNIADRLTVGEVWRDRNTRTAELARICLETAKPQSGEAEYRLGEESLYSRLEISPLRDMDGHIRGVMGLEMDITGIRKAQQEIQSSEERFRTIVERAPYPVLLAEPDGRPLLVNEAFTEVLGYTLHHFPSADSWWLSAYPDRNYRDDVIRLWRLDVALLERDGGEAPTREWRVRALNGSEHILEQRMVALGDHILVAMADYTDIITVQESLLKAKDEAEAANRAKSEFLANMSHEIRTPLNGVLGMLQLLEAENISPAQHSYVNKALNSGRSLLRLISDILDFSRMEAGALELRDEPFDLRRTFQELHAMFSVQLGEDVVTLDMNIDESVPPALIGDEARLRQILFNLVGNSVKFTHQGNISVSASAVRTEGGLFRVHMLISDTGVGIPVEKQNSVFDPFTQVEGSFARSYQGTGLGLGIVSRLVDHFGGSLFLCSQPGEGTTFRISLPFAPAKHEGKSKKRTERKESGGSHLLLAEDDPTNRDTAQAMLSRLGHSIDVAENGMEALKMLAENTYDCVLMDVRMPVMDGLEATRRIRSGDRQGIDPTIPVIAVTAHAMAGDREQFLSAGMDDYISKPLDMRDLENLLNRVLAFGQRA